MVDRLNDETGLGPVDYRQLKMAGVPVDFRQLLRDKFGHTYHGDRDPLGLAVVTVDHHQLDLRTDIRNHSPTGFEWGYAGSGPAQLALAILCYEFGESVAVAWYQDFKHQVVAGFKREGFAFTSMDVVDWMQKVQAAHRYNLKHSLTAGGGKEKENG